MNICCTQSINSALCTYVWMITQRLQTRFEKQRQSLGVSPSKNAFPTGSYSYSCRCFSPHVLTVVPAPDVVATVTPVLIVVILLARLRVVAVRALVAIAASVIHVAAMVVLVNLSVINVVHLIMRMVTVLALALGNELAWLSRLE